MRHPKLLRELESLLRVIRVDKSTLESLLHHHLTTSLALWARRSCFNTDVDFPKISPKELHELPRAGTLGNRLDAGEDCLLAPDFQRLDRPRLVGLFEVVEHGTVAAKTSLQEHLDRARGANRAGILTFHHRKGIRDFLEDLVDLLDELDYADRDFHPGDALRLLASHWRILDHDPRIAGDRRRLDPAWKEPYRIRAAHRDRLEQALHLVALALLRNKIVNRRLGPETTRDVIIADMHERIERPLREFIAVRIRLALLQNMLVARHHDIDAVRVVFACLDEQAVDRDKPALVVAL